MSTQRRRPRLRRSHSKIQVHFIGVTRQCIKNKKTHDEHVSRNKYTDLWRFVGDDIVIWKFKKAAATQQNNTNCQMSKKNRAKHAVGTHVHFFAVICQTTTVAVTLERNTV